MLNLALGYPIFHRRNSWWNIAFNVFHILMPFFMVENGLAVMEAISFAFIKSKGDDGYETDMLFLKD